MIAIFRPLSTTLLHLREIEPELVFPSEQNRSTPRGPQDQAALRLAI